MCYTQVDLLWPPRTLKYKLGIQGFSHLHYQISILSMGPTRCCSKRIPHCPFSFHRCYSLQVPPCCSCTGLTNSCSRIFLKKL